MANRRKFVILDGNSLANRAFYALRLFSTSDGVYTNAVYGFLNMLYRLLEEENPDYLAIAFDKGRVTFRHADYADYKGTRKAPPDEFRPQLDLIREVLTALNIKWLRMDNYEADDLVGTLAKQAAEQGVDVLVVTGDRDQLQLINDRVSVMMTLRGITKTTLYTPETLKQEYGITPSQVVDLKALMGDSSDNIPGVPGVGKKTAMKLLNQYETVDNVYAQVDEIKGALQRRLKEGKELAMLSKKLATICVDVPGVVFDPDEYAVVEPNYPEAQALFRRLEFKTLLPKVMPSDENGDPQLVLEATVPQVKAETVTDPARLEAVAARDPVALIAPCSVPADDPGRPQPDGAAVFAGKQSLWLTGDALAELGRFLEQWSVAGYDLKPLYNWAYGRGHEPKVPDFDVVLAAYLLDSGRATYRLSDLVRQYDLGELSEDDSPDAWATRASLIPALQEKMLQALEEEGLLHVFRDIEMPLLPILAEMEANGVGIDKEALADMSVELEQRIQQLTAEIHQLAGESFNIASPKQLGEILFGKLGLPAGRKTKTGGYSTSADVLEELAGDYPIVGKVLDYRSLTKLKSTYVDALGALVAQDGRIHTTFAQTVTETGRLSSKDPNLQNIPIRMEEGRRVRRAFVPAPGNLIVAVDYSQIELRVVAHYSGDPALRDAFAHDQDIHTRTASEVWGVPMAEVTPEMRRKAKAVNFGLIYGQTEFGLARAVGMTRPEARAFIETYFEKFAGVKEYMENKKAEAREKGYVTTLEGRKRPLPEITHRVYAVRQNAERMAINTPIQGTAADLMKKAMIKVHRALKASGLKAQMVLQVHDELVFDCPEQEVPALAALVRQEMEGAMALSVPLKVDVKVGADWYSVESYSVDKHSGDQV